MGMDEKYSIDVVSLGEGSHTLQFHIDGELFRAMESTEISDADCTADVNVTVSKGGAMLHTAISGYAVVECDRCLEDCRVPVEFDGNLEVTVSDIEGEYDGEHMTIRKGESIPMAQYLYESVVISLPIRRVHPDGECNPEMLARFTVSEE